MINFNSNNTLKYLQRKREKLLNKKGSIEKKQSKLSAKSRNICAKINELEKDKKAFTQNLSAIDYIIRNKEE